MIALAFALFIMLPRVFLISPYAVTAIVTGSLELEEVMAGALGKVLEVTGARTGCLYLLLDKSPPAVG